MYNWGRTPVVHGRDKNMARPLRVFSESKTYHIILKGINSQKLFFDDSDYKFFLDSFYETCQNYDVKIYAYCLMSNHIHLLLHFNENNVPVFFKSFGAKYVPKYNYYHNRNGSLFNGRYYCKNVNDDEYLFSVLRYIHYNPVKAGIVHSPEEYMYSSYNEYIYERTRYTDISFIYSIIGKEEFNDLHKSDENPVNEFIVEYDINKNDEQFIYQNIQLMLKSMTVEEVINVLKGLKMSKAKISKYLNVDRRTL